jgi:hypothetical protein
VVIGSERRLDGLFLILYSQDQSPREVYEGKKNRRGGGVESGM